MTLSDIEPGDDLWVVNGRMNSVFEATVISAQDGLVVVEVPEKDANFVFDWETGEATQGKSFLALDGDWRVKVILDRKEHAAHREALIATVAEFYRDPSTENSQRLSDATQLWLAFAQEADQHALRTNSIHEYVHYDKESVLGTAG